MAPPSASIEEASHLALEVGRILFQNNADTEEVENSVLRFAKAFGWEAHLLVTYETLILTLTSRHQFRTKAGNRVPATNVNMDAVAAVNSLVTKVENGEMELGDVRRKLEEIERRPPLYGRWIVVLGLSLTAASLSRLFGSDWPTFLVTMVAAAAGTWLRQEMSKWNWNLFFIAFVAAFISGLIVGIATLLKLSSMPALCFIASGMIIVPGVPLVNGVQDMIKNHMAIGMSRLGLGGLITLAIAFGLFAATAITNAQIPVEEPSFFLSLTEDALFSALAALGYLFLFNVPFQLAWVCILCGVVSHTTRTFCLQHHIDIVSGSLIGALAVGFLAHGFARYFRAPASAFIFPGVVAMIPGAFAFRSVIGYLQIIERGSEASPLLLTGTIALSATTFLMVLVIAVGAAAPLILMKRDKLQ